MTTRGVLRSWVEEEGWGVIDSPGTPGGCWVHLTHLAGAARVGEALEFTFEPADQDGYRFRALRAWPAGDPPRRAPGTSVFNDRSGAFASTLTLSFDDGTPDTTTHWPPEPEPVLGTVTVTVFSREPGRNEVRVESAGTLDEDLLDAAVAELRRVRAGLP